MDSSTTISNQNADSIQGLERKLMLKQLQIDSLLEVTNSINSNLSGDALFRIYEFILRAQMGVEGLVVFHLGQEYWSCTCCYGISEKAIGEIDVERDLFAFKDTTQISEFDSSPLQPFEVIVPVNHKESPLAFLLISKIKTGDDTGSLDEKIKFIQTITNIIIVAIENKRLFKQQLEQESLKKELEVAERVQSMLVPKVLPNNEHLEMEAVYMPHHNIGGDYYDYIQLNEDEFIICMADISGKGVAAAILMANAQAIIRALARETKNLEDLVLKLNDRLNEITAGDKYLTLFVAHHNLKTRKMSYINAGHNPPILVQNNKLESLDRGCTILGIIPELPFLNYTELTLSPGAFIITYTDGLTDLENEAGEFFMMERLWSFTEKNLEQSTEDFNLELLQEIKAFKGRQVYTDDISILTYRLF